MNLWEQTCFECFVAPDAATEYREFNYSPSGDWHSFMFPEYRAPLKPSDDTTLAVTDQVINPHEATFTLTLTFSHLKFSSTDWLISPAVVLLDIQGQHHYYALQHPASRPDFHLPTLRQLRLGYQ